jgi:hypothetical protein
VSAASIAIVSQTFLRDAFFPQNIYFNASSPEQLPKRFHDYVPVNASDIRLRTYQSAWWVTVESTCKEVDAATWALSINRPLDSNGQIPELPDHSLPANELGFVPITNTPNRYLWHVGNQGNVSNVVYDRKTKRLYYLQSRI